MKVNVLAKAMLAVVFCTYLLSAQNNAMLFDGSDDFISVPDVTYDNITVEAWIYRTSDTDTWEHIFSDWYDDGESHRAVNLSLWNDSDNGDVCKLGGSISTTGGGGSEVNSSSVFELNVWYHVALSYDGSTMKLYINGIEESSNSSPSGNIHNNNYSKKIASRATGNGLNFPGMIDEFRIWDDARTEAEIRANMYRELAGTESNLLVYYKMDEASGVTLEDSQSSGSNDGTWNGSGGGTYTSATRQPSSVFFGPKYCVDLDGSDDYINCGQDASLTGMSDITLEAWVYPDVADEHRIILSNFGVYESSGGYQLVVTSNELFNISYRDQNYTDRGVSGVNTYTANKWYHVAGTIDWDGSDITLKIYVNGVLENTQTYTGSSYQMSFDSVTDLFIGTNYDGVPPGGPSHLREFDGKIDEIRIWKDVRTADEIREYMFKPIDCTDTDLVAYYNFDQTSGTDLPDYSGSGNDGTLTNMTDADWVSCTAFNTWLNTSSTTWSTATNWSRGSAPASGDNVGIVNYTGEPDISGSPTFNHLYLGSGIGTSLSSGMTVNGNLLLDKDLDLNGQTVSLGSSATLLEGNGCIGGSSGQIQTTRNLSDIDEDVAGLGAGITEDGDLGSCTIVRKHAAPGSSAIERVYQITTTNSPSSATLVFHYDDSELNGLTESSLKLFKSSDGSSWTEQSSSTVNTTDNTITLTGINAFSHWTAAPSGTESALSIALLGFTGKSSEQGIRLSWSTASETQNQGFIIEKRIKGDENWLRIADYLNKTGLLGHGTTSENHSYAFCDRDIVPGMTYEYRLADVDHSGTVTWHPVLEVPVPEGSMDDLEFSLKSIYPNPFNPSTKIRLHYAEACNSTVSVYNVHGELVERLVDGYMDAGRYDLSWNAGHLPSGVYVVKMVVGDFFESKKVVLMK